MNIHGIMMPKKSGSLMLVAVTMVYIATKMEVTVLMSTTQKAIYAAACIHLPISGNVLSMSTKAHHHNATMVLITV